MEFLVQADWSIPSDLPPDRLEALQQAEAARGLELKAQGIIVRIWRVPGRRRSVGIWEAADATVLNEILTALPMFPWVEFSVTPLARHPTYHD
jgi:muconolactone D-isomerase